MVWKTAPATLFSTTFASPAEPAMLKSACLLLDFIFFDHGAMLRYLHKSEIKIITGVSEEIAS